MKKYLVDEEGLELKNYSAVICASDTEEKTKILNFIDEINGGGEKTVSIFFGRGIGDDTYPSEVSANGIRISLGLFADLFGITPLNTQGVLSFLKKKGVPFEVFNGKENYYGKNAVYKYRGFVLRGCEEPYLHKTRKFVDVFLGTRRITLLTNGGMMSEYSLILCGGIVLPTDKFLQIFCKNFEYDDYDLPGMSLWHTHGTGYFSTSSDFKTAVDDVVRKYRVKCDTEEREWSNGETVV